MMLLAPLCTLFMLRGDGGPLFILLMLCMLLPPARAAPPPLLLMLECDAATALAVDVVLKTCDDDAVPEAPPTFRLLLLRLVDLALLGVEDAAATGGVRVCCGGVDFETPGDAVADELAFDGACGDEVVSPPGTSEVDDMTEDDANDDIDDADDEAVAPVEGGLNIAAAEL